MREVECTRESQVTNAMKTLEETITYAQRATDELEERLNCVLKPSGECLEKDVKAVSQNTTVGLATTLNSFSALIKRIIDKTISITERCEL